ncbi:hypothetical protein COOONC_24835 [Cooperia oncophora]
MVAVRFIMMALLMEATDDLLRSSINECIREAKHEAEPKLLAKSSALAALSSLGGGDESDDEDSDGDEKKQNANGEPSPVSESGEDNAAFKTPFGVPRKSSKQTSSTTEDSSTAVTAGDGMDSDKTNLRHSGKNDTDKNGSEKSDSRRRRSRSRYGQGAHSASPEVDLVAGEQVSSF